MLSLALVGDEKFSLNDIAKVNHIGMSKAYFCDWHPGDKSYPEYTVEFGKIITGYMSVKEKIKKVFKSINHLTYSYYDDEALKVDYTEETLKKIPFKQSVFIILEFKDVETMKRILRQSDFPQNIYVCDDFGFILPLHEFNKCEWDSRIGCYPKGLEIKGEFDKNIVWINNAETEKELSKFRERYKEYWHPDRP